MAPTPTEDNNLLTADPTSTPKPSEGYWTKPNIALTAIFALLALTIFTLLLVFFLRRRSQKKKLAHRKSDKAGLLANEDKSSMFSSTRHSSVTLYVDEDTEARNMRRASQDPVPLVPLQITPAEEVRNPMNTPTPITTTTTTTASNGSGVSAVSRLSTNTASTLMLSPVSPNGDEGDLSVRQYGRPRSTSSTSQKARYYESTPTDTGRMMIPRIVRTVSD
jgi:hypothetical protein